MRVTTKALREAAKILQTEREAPFLDEALLLIGDSSAALDNDHDAAERLRKRYAKGDPADKAGKDAGPKR